MNRPANGAGPPNPFSASPRAASVAPMPSVSPSPSPASLSAAVPWEDLRRSARQLENDVEGRLAAYARLAMGAAGGLPGGAEDAERELEGALDKLSGVTDRMAVHLDSAPQTSASMMHMLQRHRDILYDFRKEFKKIKANIAAAAEHASLLSTNGSPSASADTDYLLTERTRIDSSIRMADQVLSQAHAARQDLAQQGRQLYGSERRLQGGVLSRFPLINKLVKRIDAKKRRDACVLGSVVSVCVVLLVWWLLARG
ncbi:hypothetical protein DFJ74DRAFT_652667 [Hyaloraphidium curvatum]|nr:hypothetical protein DFJ74DRAFT_652667 [Hyaloraphidium curvatum]